jgi:hypothetical protein
MSLYFLQLWSHSKVLSKLVQGPPQWIKAFGHRTKLFNLMVKYNMILTIDSNPHFTIISFSLLEQILYLYNDDESFAWWFV